MNNLGILDKEIDQPKNDRCHNHNLTTVTHE